MHETRSIAGPDGVASALAALNRGVVSFLDRISAPTAGRLVSLTLPLDCDLPMTPAAGLAESRFIARPESGVWMVGVGVAARLHAFGPGRFNRMGEFLERARKGWVQEAGSGADPAFAPRAFLGFAFDGGSGPVTGADILPNSEISLPLLVIEKRDGKTAATFTARWPREGGTESLRRIWLAAAEMLLARMALPPARCLGDGGLVRQSCQPADAAWRETAARAIADIRSGRLEKVVLTRRIQVKSEHPFRPDQIIGRLAEEQPNCTLFAFANGPVTALGASPERLVSLHRGVVVSDAIAGTLARTDFGPDDDPLGAALLASDKDIHEHRLVVEAIAAALMPACTHLRHPDRPKLLRLASLHHLWTPVTALARPGTSLLDLAARLHPTPAVGGTPHRVAMEWLARTGERRLGWYTGGIGWATLEGDGEISVVLRCATITGDQAVLSAGAGIVAASDPDRELEETELKLRTMLKALGNGR